MRIVEKQTREVDVLVDVTCDICGKPCRDEHGNEPNFATLSATWGWGSHKDGEEWEAHICEKCCDALPFLDKIRHRSYLPWEGNENDYDKFWVPMNVEIQG
jgi:hypothetical protein